MNLSPRLREVVDLIGGKGLSYKAAAKRMGVSPRTVEEYAAEIRARAGLPMNPRDALFVLYREQRGSTKRRRKAAKRKAAA